MSFKDWEADDWFLPLFLGFATLVFVSMFIYLGWADWQENATINHCLDSGKQWKDGNCV